jgi:hypothetical protein
MNGDGSSLRAVFPCLDKALAKQVRRVDGTARISAWTRANSAFPRSDCGMLSRRAHSCYRPDRGHPSSIHEIRARTRYLSSFCQQ